MKKEIVQGLDHYDEVVKEIDVLKKYGYDYTSDRGTVREYIDRIHPTKLILTVTDIIDESPSAKTFRLSSIGVNLPPFQAGQYLALYFKIGGVRTGRAYSISSPPNHSGYFDITVRRVEDGFVSGHLMDDIKIGDSIETSGPSGNFCYNPVIHDSTSVFLAGGSGITPFMSAIREIAECGLDRTVHLFYGNRSESDVIFGGELDRISSKFSGIHVYHVIEKPKKSYKGLKGFITSDLIKKTLKDLSGKTYYICGPKAMYDFCLPQLEGLAIPVKKIRRELYGPPRDITRHKGWPSSINGSDQFRITIRGVSSIAASAGEPILNSLEREGITVPSLCRSGECSMCRIKLLSGTVFQPEGVLLRRSDRRYGYLHSCAAYPLEDLEILL